MHSKLDSGHGPEGELMGSLSHDHSTPCSEVLSVQDILGGKEL